MQISSFVFSLGAGADWGGPGLLAEGWGGEEEANHLLL